MNRSRVRDCTRFRAKLVPIVVDLMMDNPHHDWGPVTYPVDASDALAKACGAGNPVVRRTSGERPAQRVLVQGLGHRSAAICACRVG